MDGQKGRGSTPEVGQSSGAVEPQLRVLSLGAGVQSTTVLLLALEGVLPPLDAAIFADTGWEPRKVYDHLERVRALCDLVDLSTREDRGQLGMLEECEGMCGV